MPEQFQETSQPQARSGTSTTDERGSTGGLPSSVPRLMTRCPLSPDQYGLQILWPKNEGAGKEPIADVVAVHGIGAHPYYTWQKSVTIPQPHEDSAHTTEKKVHWLGDEQMLPRLCPRARIMTFGYDSQWFGDNAVQQDLSSVAKNLLLALRARRRNCLDRPLIFVGHCYGGLVIQKALITAHHYPNRSPKLFKSTAGIVFLGTPHRGTGTITSKGMMETLIDQYSECHIETSILESLKAENRMLNEMRNEFVELWTRRHGRGGITCFYEQRRTRVGKIIGVVDTMSEFVVDMESGTLDGFPSHALALDHFELNKFSGPKDFYYMLVRDEIRKLLHRSPAYQQSFTIIAYETASKGSASDIKQLVDLGRRFMGEVTGISLLGSACRCGNDEVVGGLLQAGIDVDAGGSMGVTPLQIATQNGHLTIVQQLVKAKANLEIGYSSPPLCRAANEGFTEIAFILLQNGAKTDAKTSRLGWTALHLAAKYGHLAVLQKLIAANANVEDRRNSDMIVPLHLACEEGHQNVVGALLKAGADVNVQDHLGLSPLHKSVKAGHIEIINTLLASRANKELTAGSSQRTPLYGAVLTMKPDVVHILLEAGADVNVQDHLGLSPLHISIEAGHLEITHMLLAFEANTELTTRSSQSTPLHYAARLPKSDMMRILLEAGANLDVQDIHGLTPLYRSVQDGSIDIIRVLLTFGANTELMSRSTQSTPLYCAVSVSDLTIVCMLLEAGAGTRRTRKDGSTPLHRAVTNLHPEIVRRLLAADADPNVHVAAGNTTLLHLAARKGHRDILRLLLDAGARRNALDGNGNTASQIARNSKHRKTEADLVGAVNHRREHFVADKHNSEATPVPRAISTTEIKAVPQKPSNPTSVNRRGPGGLTPLHDAVISSRSSTVIELLESGADINARTDRGNTPLHCCRYAEIANILIARGADTGAKNRKGLTPVLFAAEKGRMSVVRALGNKP